MPPKYIHANTVKEHHGKPIFCVTFNTYDPANQDLVASVGGHQATVYRCHAEGRIEVLQVYVDDYTQRLNDEPNEEEEEFFCCKWTIARATRDPLLLLAGKLALLRVVNCTTNTAVLTLKGHGKEINDISVHQQHPHLVLTASKDHSIRLWNIATGCCVLLMRGPGAHAGEVFTLDFHPWDPFLFVSGAMEGAVKVWSLKEHWSSITASEEWDEPPQQRAFPVRLVAHPVFSSRQVHSNYVDCCRWLGDLVLSKTVDYKIKLWRPLYPDNPILETSSKFEVLQVFEQYGYSKPIWWVRFAIDPRGQVLVCGNDTGKAYVWEPGPGRPQRGRLLAHKQCSALIRQTAVSMDASMIICSTDDGHLWRWDRQGAALTQQQTAQEPLTQQQKKPMALTQQQTAQAPLTQQQEAPLTQQQTTQAAQQHASSSRRNSRATPGVHTRAGNSGMSDGTEREEQQQQHEKADSKNVADSENDADDSSSERGEDRDLEQEAGAAAAAAAAAAQAGTAAAAAAGPRHAADGSAGSSQAKQKAPGTGAAAAVKAKDTAAAGEQNAEFGILHGRHHEPQPMQVDAEEQQQQQQQQQARRVWLQPRTGVPDGQQQQAARVPVDVIVIDSDSD